MSTSPARSHALDLDAAALEERGQLQQLLFDPGRNTIHLEDMVLVEDDAPAIGRPEGAADEVWFEHLRQGIVLRKELVLDEARARAAFLLFCGREETGNEYPLHLRVNGHALVRPPTRVAHPQARHYYTTDWGGAHFDNWFVVPLPVGALRKGANEVLLWAESEDKSWEIMVAAEGEYARGSQARHSHADRSARSQDGGRTWDWARLGWKGEVDGEYCVRLSLDRYASGGLYRSPVIDVAPGEGPLAGRLDLERCRVEWEVELPRDTGARIRARWGSSPLPGAGSWSPYEPVEGLAHTWEKAPGRYLQFEVELGTEDPLHTPAFKGVRILSEARPHPLSPGAPRLLRLENGRVVRSSVDFVHEDFSRLQALRKRFELDRVVAGAATEFEAQLRLMRWAYTVPIGRLDPYAWRYEDLPLAERDGEGRLKSLGPYNRRRREGHCLYCNLTLVAACLAMGFPARWVNVSTKHTYGHEVTEVWSNDFDKWVFLDATRDYYLCDAESGLPLSLVEISQRLGAALPAPATWDFPVQHWLPAGIRPEQMGLFCPPGESPHPVFDPQVGSEDLVLMGHLQMPLRNDFASRPHPVPWRLSSNWGSDQFYCWYGDSFPRKREYARHTRRWQDFNPALNQAELFLSRTGEEGVLRVEVDTQTPCFQTFLLQRDGGAWEEEQQAAWDWPLHPGLNRLCVRARNSAGVCGPQSRAEVVWPG